MTRVLGARTWFFDVTERALRHLPAEGARSNDVAAPLFICPCMSLSLSPGTTVKSGNC